MPESPLHDVTGLLLAWSEGNEATLEKLVPLVHAELRKLAHRQMGRERRGHTLQTTALVNEVYLRLVDTRQISLQSRAQFFALCAQLMRRILVDYARSRHSRKRGGGAVNVTLHDSLVGAAGRARELVALDDALNALAGSDVRKARVVELRYFGGLSVEETAGALGISEETVHRDWKFARAWLEREMTKATRGKERAKGAAGQS
ncbi:MAG: sigma-70 family RNA polymerase sigma factor [Candidatus Korobacteraceae bacterium]